MSAAVVVIRPPGRLELTALPDLRDASLEALVGGYLECPLVFDGEAPGDSVGVYCDEEGKLKHLPATCYVQQLYDVLCGPLLVVGFNESGGLRGLSEPEIEAVQLVRRPGAGLGSLPILHFYLRR